MNKHSDTVTADGLRAEVLAEVERIGAIPISGPRAKATFREMHSEAVRLQVAKRQGWIQSVFPRIGTYLADGSDVKPESIEPVLQEVREQWHSDLFRLARLTWSLPFSKGYGRRLRFLLLDRSNGKLIGILGLQSPPLDFPARDRLFDYPKTRKVELVNQTMDIYTLGAVPPYSSLLGGKLVALAAASNEIREAYSRKYAGYVTELQKKSLPARLVALTTTSAFGRSSIYNRLKLDGDVIAQSIGYTEGYSSFHLAPLYPALRAFLDGHGVSSRGGFGVGPRVVWQTMVRALERLGLSSEVLRHGVRREAFLFPLIDNLRDYMEGRTDTPQFRDLPFTTLCTYWRKRWLLPRAERVDGWRSWQRQEIRRLLTVSPRTTRE
jgi:hypothetical protein